MKKEFSLSYQKQYHFCFSFELGGPADGCQYPLSVSLCRKDIPGLTWDWNKCLLRGQEVEFRLSYADTINIKGEFHLFHSPTTDEDFLFLDVWFGSQYEEHYEGNIMELGLPPDPDPDPEPDPDPDPDPEPDPDPDDERILPAGYHDLFPFLHLRSWPEVTAVQQQSFIEYSDNGSLPPAADLYANLLKLTTRPAIEAEADLFINGGGGYTGLFIDDVAALPFPFNRYTEVYDLLLDRETLNLIETQSATTLLSSLDYAKEINIVWQNVFALAIINGYRVDVVEQLLKILIVDHLLQLLSASPPIAGRESWRRLIRSSVVLPATLFPLPADSAASPPAGSHPFVGQVTPYAIGHLQKVQHCHTGYALGEIAQVENVAIGEVKQVKHRQTLVTEEKKEHGTDQKDQRHRQNTSSQLEQEATRALDQTIKDEWDFTNLSISYGPPTTGTYGGKVDKTRDTKLNNDTSNRFARNILAAAIERVAQSVIHHRQTSVRQETEDMVVRTIDNRRGTRNIRSIYRWLNKLYQLRLVDYGQRLILELLIDHPDRPYLPDHHRPTVPTRKVSALLNETQFFPTLNLPVPEGYIPTSVTFTYNVPLPALLIVGTKQASLSPTSSTVTIDDPMNIGDSPIVIDTVPILLDLSQATQSSPPAPPAPFYCSIVMECTAAPLKKDHEEKDSREPHNPQIAERARRIWVTEACKSVLYQVHRGQTGSQQPARLSAQPASPSAQPASKPSGNTMPPGNTSPPDDTIFRPEYLQFIDEAFEWREISFSNHEENQQEKMRILLPVNPGFSYKALYYLSTGIPWYGRDRLTPVIANQLPIAAALQQAASIGKQNKYEILLDTWLEAVPTSMQWLQDDDRLPGLNT